MRIIIKDFISPVIVSSLIVLTASFSWASSTERERVPDREIITHDKAGHESAALSTILPVLGSKIGDHHLLEKAKDKLATLSGAEIRLIASLCDRIAEDSNSPGSDIAFLLVTALIVLS